MPTPQGPQTQPPANPGRAASRPLPELIAHLKTSEVGLTDLEAKRRHSLRLPRQRGALQVLLPMLRHLRASFNPLIVILLIAGGASAFLGGVSDAVIIATIVLLSAGLNFRQTFRSERAARQLAAQIRPTAFVRRAGQTCEIQRDSVVDGDIILLSAGNLVPADARLIEASDLHVQQSALTGESFPANKYAISGELDSSGPDSPALVFLGTSVISGTGAAIVFASGPDTSFGDIVERLAERPEETEFDRGARKFGLLVFQTVTFLVFFVLVINISLGRNALESLLF